MKKRIPLLLACLLLTGCGVETESYDQPPQVMVDDTLYITTGHPVPGQSSADTEVEGTITSEVDSPSLPQRTTSPISASDTATEQACTRAPWRYSSTATG